MQKLTLNLVTNHFQICFTNMCATFIFHPYQLHLPHNLRHTNEKASPHFLEELRFYYE